MIFYVEEEEVVVVDLAVEVMVQIHGPEPAEIVKVAEDFEAEIETISVMVDSVVEEKRVEELMLINLGEEHHVPKEVAALIAGLVETVVVLVETVVDLVETVVVLVVIVVTEGLVVVEQKVQGLSNLNLN
jgi:hypothetical protein